MKIISKYKDYYDYLSGIYGEDPKLILDRRDSIKYSFYFPKVFSLYICGKRIDGYFDGINFHYGENLKNFGKFYKLSDLPSWQIHDKTSDFVVINESKFHHTSPAREISLNIDIIDDLKKYNEKVNCPILFDYRISNPIKFPQLSKLQVNKILSPEEIYQMLINWLSDKINKSEIIVDNRNDVDKLLSKGFDKKESFRPKIKN